MESCGSHENLGEVLPENRFYGTAPCTLLKVGGSDGERIMLHNTKRGETVAVAEDLEGVYAVAARGNLVAAAFDGEIWLIKIEVLDYY